MVRFNQFLVKTFVDLSTAAKWCPGQDCDLAYEKQSGNSIEIQCKCSARFCIGCDQGPHAPISCERLEEWKKKVAEVGYGGDSKSDSWITSNTKPCPRCKAPIEKAYGCNYMKCQSCSYEFCWLCLGGPDVHERGFGHF